MVCGQCLSEPLKNAGLVEVVTCITHANLICKVCSTAAVPDIIVPRKQSPEVTREVQVPRTVQAAPIMNHERASAAAPVTAALLAIVAEAPTMGTIHSPSIPHNMVGGVETL